MKRSAFRIWGAAAVLAAVMIATPRLSPAPVFMKLGDIKGESTDSDHKDWIIIESWSWGASRASAAGAPSSDHADWADLVCVKELDKSSPKLMEACASGRPLTSGTLVLTREGTQGQEPYLVIKLKDVIISSYKPGGSASGDALPTESVSLNFAKVEYTYYYQGAAGPEPISENWDIKNNGPVRPPSGSASGVIVE